MLERYNALCEGGPLHGQSLTDTKYRHVIPVLENDLPLSPSDQPMSEDFVKAKVGTYIYVPAHWKWLPPEE